MSNNDKEAKWHSDDEDGDDEQVNVISIVPTLPLPLEQLQGTQEQGWGSPLWTGHSLVV